MPTSHAACRFDFQIFKCSIYFRVIIDGDKNSQANPKQVHRPFKEPLLLTKWSGKIYNIIEIQLKVILFYMGNKHLLQPLAGKSSMLNIFSH